MNGPEILAAAHGMAPWLSDVRRQLHTNPELGLEEHKTATAIENWLDGLGIPHERRLTAVTALVRGAADGPTVAVRADIDALPITEETGLPFASQVAGRMHACGHDAHTAILLGTAKFFAERRDAFRGCVKLLFQPAEETVGGAATMIADGCLENPRVDAVIGLHVMPYLPVGCVELKKGVMSGSSATLSIVVRGRSGHGAYPESGIDAILIAANVVMSLNALVSRYVSPLDQAVLTIGTIQGGARANIIADEVTMRATLRTTSDKVRTALLERARAVVEDVPRAYGGLGELSVSYGYVALVNNDAVVDVVADAAQELLGLEAINWKEKPSMGVEDFSYYLKERPGAFFHLGCGFQGRENAQLHSSNFDLDERCLPLGVALEALTALKLLGAHDSVAAHD